MKDFGQWFAEQGAKESEPPSHVHNQTVSLYCYGCGKKWSASLERVENGDECAEVYARAESDGVSWLVLCGRGPSCVP